MKRITLVLCPTLLLLSLACSKAPETNVNHATTAPSPQTSPASTPVVTKTETPAGPAAGSLATPTDAYKFAYAARQNKDLAGLKRVLSKDALEFLTEIGKEEKKTLDDQLKTLTERPQAAKPETRNEKITGNQATLEYLDEKGKWQTMDFVKDGNDWRIGLPKVN
ncbi:MAG TPA: hypothetical protein VIR01_21500 [Pyrinomonadaceae bacterium]